MAICSLVEEFSLVGFETLAVEDKESMLHLTHAIDRARLHLRPIVLGNPCRCKSTLKASAGRSAQTNMRCSQPPRAPYRVPEATRTDVRERWVDAREEYDALESREWRKEGEAIRDERARESRQPGSQIIASYIVHSHLSYIE